MSANKELLYHYTNQAGLIGILRYKNLWATRIHYLNDADEFWHTMKTAHHAIRVRIDNETDSLKKLQLEDLLGDFDLIAGVETCVTSFSEDGDSLSQWRGYAKDEPGFALGFDADALKRIAKGLNTRFEQCIYKSAEQAQKVEEIITETLAKDFGPFPNRGMTVQNGAPVMNTDPCGKFANRLLGIAALHKHPAFFEESEWRFVYHPHSSPLPVKHRPGKSMLIPYVELDVLLDGSLSCLKEIIIGPCPHHELSGYSLRALLNAEHISHRVEIKPSTAPYRYW